MDSCKFCGMAGVYKTATGSFICSKSTNSCPAVRKKNSESLQKSHKMGVMRKFSDNDRDRSYLSIEKKFSELPFELQSYKRRRDFVIKEQDSSCLICGLSVWQGKPINLQIDHIDGNNKNNDRSNLRALCPNCHSLTETFNSGKKIVSDSDILSGINEGLNNRQILLKLGLTPKGANYDRVNSLRNVNAT